MPNRTAFHPLLQRVLPARLGTDGVPLRARRRVWLAAAAGHLRLGPRPRRRRRRHRDEGGRGREEEAEGLHQEAHWDQGEDGCTKGWLNVNQI